MRVPFPFNTIPADFRSGRPVLRLGQHLRTVAALISTSLSLIAAAGTPDPAPVLSHFVAESALYRKLLANETGAPVSDPAAPRPRVRMSGALMTRLFPDEEIGRIFQRHGYQATFVVRTPASYRRNEAYKDLLRRLVAMGHDIGFWTDASPSCLQLYDPDDASDFLALDRDPEVWDATAQRPRIDRHGSPATGIAEVLRIRGEVYLGLNNSIKYQTERDVVVRPVHGTDRIVIENLPAVISSGSFYVYFEPDEKSVPAKIRGRWVTVGGQPNQPGTVREQPVLMYEAISLRDYAGELFHNPAGQTVLVRAGLDINREGKSYTTVNRAVGYTNMPNERARLYTYAHALRAFHLMGLPRPLTVGEPRCLYEATSPSARPLKQLGFIAGGVDPLQGGHTYFMPDHLRYRIATSGGGAPPPLAHTPVTQARNAEFIDLVFEGRANGIGFNRNYFEHGDSFDYVGYAFSRVCQAVAKHRFINERQTVAYTTRERQFWDRLLRRCRENQIPVLSQRQAMVHLFDCEPATGNPVPAIETDLDHDGIPDGYGVLPAGCTWNSSPDPSLKAYDGRHFSRTTPGDVFHVYWMGGIKPGQSAVRLWVNGSPGDELRVSVVQKQYQTVEGQRFGQTVTDRPSQYNVVVTQTGWRLVELGTVERQSDCFFHDLIVAVVRKAGPKPVGVSQLILE